MLGGGGVTPQVQSAARARVALPPSRGARLELQEKLTLHPADPAGPVAPPYVGDQLEKHDVGCRECRGRICFDLSSSAAHWALDKWLIAAKPQGGWFPGTPRRRNNGDFKGTFPDNRREANSSTTLVFPSIPFRLPFLLCAQPRRGNPQGNKVPLPRAWRRGKDKGTEVSADSKTFRTWALKAS